MKARINYRKRTRPNNDTIEKIILYFSEDLTAIKALEIILELLFL